jgi:hypothetical protein
MLAEVRAMKYRRSLLALACAVAIITLSLPPDLAADWWEVLHCVGGSGIHGGVPPHTQGTGSSDPDACHGMSGDEGTCTIGSGSNLASVSCWGRIMPNGNTVERCSATASCGAAGDIFCGDIGAEAFAGINDQTGKGFVNCRVGGVISHIDCP